MTTLGHIQRLQAVRFAFGIGLLAGPAQIIECVTGRAPDRRALLAARILGGRQLLESAALTLWPQAAVLSAGAAVDLIHAAMTATVGWRAPDRRRLALANAVTALAFAAAGLRLASPSTSSNRGKRR